MEVYTLCPEKIEIAHKKTFNNLLRELNKIKSKFALSVFLRSWFDNKVDLKKVGNRVNTWVKSLPDKKGDYVLKINEYGVHAKINAYFSDHVMNSPVVSWGDPGGVIDHHTNKLQDRFGQKIKKYKFVKSQNKPFILAVTADQLMFADTAIDWSLYGLDVISFSIDNKTGVRPEPSFHRDYSGFITPNPGLFGQPQNTRLSAVILCQKKWSGDQMMFDLRVHHNPWAKHRIPENIFEKMSQFVETGSKPGYITLEWKNKGNLIKFD